MQGFKAAADLYDLGTSSPSVGVRCLHRMYTRCGSCQSVHPGRSRRRMLCSLLTPHQHITTAFLRMSRSRAGDGSPTCTRASNGPCYVHVLIVGPALFSKGCYFLAAGKGPAICRQCPGQLCRPCASKYGCSPARMLQRLLMACPHASAERYNIVLEAHSFALEIQRALHVQGPAADLMGTPPITSCSRRTLCRSVRPAPLARRTDRLDPSMEPPPAGPPTRLTPYHRAW